MRLLTLLLLFLIALFATACGGNDATPTSDERSDAPAGSDAVRVQLQQPTIEGGAFVEGFIAAYVVDPEDPQTLDATQYEDAVTIELEPGRHDVLVLVYPCDARCVSWDEAMDRVGAREQAETNPGAKLIVRCRTTIDVGDAERGELALQPVIEVGPLAELTPDGRPCRIEDGLSERS